MQHPVRALSGGIINPGYLDSQKDSFVCLASTVFCQTEVFPRVIHLHLADPKLGHCTVGRQRVLYLKLLFV